MLVTVVDTLFLFFCRSVWTSFFYPCPGLSPQRRFALSAHAKGLGKIIFHPAGHSVVTGFRATKKAGTQMRTDFPQKDRLIPCGVASHLCNRLWNSKSKLSFTLYPLPTVQGSLEATAFSLACRRCCPAYCRSLNQFVKIYSVAGQINCHFILYRTNVCLSRW